MSNFTSPYQGNVTLAVAQYSGTIKSVETSFLNKKQFRLIIAVLLLVLFSGMSNHVFAFGTTYYYPSSVSAGGGGTYCVGTPAAALTGTISDGSATAIGGLSSTVNYYWYYNTTGTAGTLTGATLVLTGTAYTAGAAAHSAPLPSASISTATAGVYYYFLYVTYAGGSAGAGSLYSGLVTVTVQNTLPITGTTTICQGATSALTDATPGGVWSSTVPSVGTVSGTGVVTGISGGTTTISYNASCGTPASIVVSVTPFPGVITGPGVVCTGSTITMSDSPPVGTWSSSVPTIGSVSTSGIVTGLTAGTTLISYSDGCGTPATKAVTVNPLPAAITGPDSLCPGGATITLNDATSFGTWSSSTTSVATTTPVGPNSGIVTSGVSGTTTITYTSPLNCIATKVIVVDPLPSPINGVLKECAGTPSSLTDVVTGGTWSSNTPPVATIDINTGLLIGITGGTTVITYATVCGYVTAVDTSITTPTPIVGTDSVCVGGTTTYASLPTGGTWTSSTPAIATVLSGSGLITAVSAGKSAITYTIPPGCFAVDSVNILALPPVINGTRHVCEGATVHLTDGFTGGTWSSAQTYVASINVTTGVVTGVAVDTANITYTDRSGCQTSATITVNPAPVPIIGGVTTCASLTDTLYDATAGGVWSSGAPGIASVSASGVVTTISGGTAIISYTLPGSGCAVSKTFSVNPLPAAIVTYNAATNTFYTSPFDSTYQWYCTAQNLIPGATTYSTAALYYGYYWVTVMDTNGCVATSVPFNYTSGTGVANHTAGTLLRIYPNPANDVVYIESGIRVRAVISSIDGKTEMEQMDAKEMDISKLADGVHLISLYADNGQQLMVQKLIKQ